MLISMIEVFEDRHLFFPEDEIENITNIDEFKEFIKEKKIKIYTDERDGTSMINIKKKSRFKMLKRKYEVPLNILMALILTSILNPYLIYFLFILMVATGQHIATYNYIKEQYNKNKHLYHNSGDDEDGEEGL